MASTSSTQSGLGRSLVAESQAARNGDSSMIELTCKNHPDARYLTKRIPGRSLHLIRAPWVAVLAHLTENRTAQEVERLRAIFTEDELCRQYNFLECDCPGSDLIEVGGI